MTKEYNADPAELEKFNQMAHRWWDPNGEFKPLHQINPLRLNWIDQKTSLSGKTVIDIGCGGGILAEGMAQRGAIVTGIDLSEKALNVAKLHLLESGATVNYQKTSAEEMASLHPKAYDLVTCMELLEHVPQPASVIRACATLVKPDGHVFFATINRNIKSYLFAIVGAEQILKMLPPGTHHFEKFIKPSELMGWSRANSLVTQELLGLNYNPFTKTYGLGGNTDVNYLLHTIKG